MKTVKLYDDSHLYTFGANVIECIKDGEKYKIVLDKSAFFPMGGGQSGDTGRIGNAEIFDTRTDNGIIYHYSNSRVDIGEVICSIDEEPRFRKMQNHSGEHIFSGIVHNLYGFENVGFHLGDDVTVDFSGELTGEQLAEVEKLANEAIYKNISFVITYPSADELKTLDYRSKLELTEDVRIVTVDGYDRCACCAPHVKSSGEIGMIKILDFSRHRGGTRVHIICGLDALDDYNKKCENLYDIAVKLCARQNEAADIFSKYVEDVNEIKQKNSELQRELIKLKSEALESSGKNIVFFENTDAANLRNIVLETVQRCEGICAGFSGNDNDGYNFAVASNNIDLRIESKEINSAICGRGGGSENLIQGRCKADRKTIEKYFSEV